MGKKQVRLLLIEDNPGDVRLIQELLSEEFFYAYNHTVAQSIREAQQLKTTHVFDLILLDLSLPDSSGLETIKIITELYQSVPIVVLTGYHDINLWNTAIKMGVEDYFEKGNLDSKECFLSTIRFSIERFGFRTRFEKSQQRFEKLITENIDGIVVTDLNGIIKFANPPAEKMLNKRQDELVKTFFNFPLLEDFASEHVLSSDGEAPITIELRAVNTEWEDEPAKLFILRDITLSIKARQELSNAFDIINRSKAVLIKWKNVPGFPLEFISENVDSICGYTADEFKKGLVDWISITHPDDVNAVEEDVHKQSAKGSDQFTLEYRIVNKSFETRWVQNNSKSLRNLAGKIDHYESVMFDITERKLAEQELKKKNIQLNKEITTRDRMFSIIAHDLIGGYSPLIGLTDVLVDSSDDISEEDKKNIYITLNEAFNRSYQLLKNLLDWGRVQGDRLVFKPVKFKPLDILENVKSFLHAAMSYKTINLNIICDANMEIVADLNMLETILRNLVSNAIKFSSANTTIEIFVEHNNLNTLFAVKDSGAGMTENQLENLFLIGVDQSTLGTKNEKGSGLGMQLCVEFVQKHGGKIWATSKVGKGTTVMFTIPELKNDA